MKDPPTARLKPLPQSPVRCLESTCGTWPLPVGLLWDDPSCSSHSSTSCCFRTWWWTCVMFLLSLFTPETTCLSSDDATPFVNEISGLCEMFNACICFLVICSSAWSQTHRQRKHGIISASPAAAEVWTCNWHFKLIRLWFCAWTKT